MSGDGVHGVRVAVALLPNVELHEGEAEAVHLANQVEEVPVRHGGVAHLDQALVARHERLNQLFLGDEDGVVLGVERVALAADHLLQRLAGVVELIANFGENDAVGFLHGDGSPEILVVASLANLVDVVVVVVLEDLPRARLEGLGGAPHGQGEDEILNPLEV